MSTPPSYASPPSIDALYREHHPWLHGWLRRRLGNAADAAELAQDAFLRLLASPLQPSNRFRSAPEARAYLSTMAKGLCVDLWRRRQIEQAWLETLAAQPEATAPSAEHQAMVLEALQEVDAMLRNLAPKAARAFVLAVGCGMTDREVSERLEVSTRMVRKYVAQAMLHCMQLEARHAAEGAIPVWQAPLTAQDD